MKRHNTHTAIIPLRVLLFLLFASLLFVSACGRAPVRPAETPVDIAPSETAPLAPVEPTALPSSTPEPKRVILLVPAGSEPGMAYSVESVLADLSAQDGLVFETWSEFADVQLEPDVRLVVALPPDPGVANLAAANPSVQFLAIGMAGLQPASNLSLIGGSSSGPDQIGFLAGYLAGVITPDWRIGVISTPESLEGKAARNGYKNGVVFFCGLCRPAYPPFVQYPLMLDLPAGAGEVELQAVADQLAINGVKTVFLAPGVDAAVVGKALLPAGVHFIGVSSPPDELKSAWVASITFDPASTIRQIWPEISAGRGGLSKNISLAITDVNRELLSQGRQQWVEKLLNEMIGGYIDTGVDPQTGEFR